MKKLVDLTYIEHVQTATWLSRLCYPIAVSIEVKKPATALRLMEAAFCARSSLSELVGVFRPKHPDRKLQRALAAVKCVRAFLVRLGEEEAREPARITAAAEVAERLMGMITGE